MSHQHLTPDQLQTLLTSLPAGTKIEIMKSTEGGIIVTNTDTTAETKTKAQLIDEKYAHLKGQGITISQAAEEYQVPRKVVEHWIYRSQDVSFVDEASYPKKIDAAEVALCAEIYKRRQKEGLTGIPFFDDEGHLIEDVKHPDRSRRKKPKN